MKKINILLAIITTTIFTNCSKEKDNNKYCWECQIGSNLNYTDFGCGYTVKEIENLSYTDYEGNVISKKCRIKQ